MSMFKKKKPRIGIVQHFLASFCCDVDKLNQVDRFSMDRIEEYGYGQYHWKLYLYFKDGKYFNFYSPLYKRRKKAKADIDKLLQYLYDFYCRRSNL